MFQKGLMIQGAWQRGGTDMVARLGDLVKSTETVTLGSSPVGVYVGELPRELAAVLAGMIAEATSGAGVVVSDANIAISSRTLDSGGLLRKIQSDIGGKGGGSPKSANGRLNRPVTLNEQGHPEERITTSRGWR
jgi:alanyl-tRNA synthetase